MTEPSKIGKKHPSSHSTHEAEKGNTRDLIFKSENVQEFSEEKIQELVQGREKWKSHPGLREMGREVHAQDLPRPPTVRKIQNISKENMRHTSHTIARHFDPMQSDPTQTKKKH